MFLKVISFSLGCLSYPLSAVLPPSPLSILPSVLSSLLPPFVFSVLPSQLLSLLPSLLSLPFGIGMSILCLSYYYIL